MATPKEDFKKAFQTKSQIIYDINPNFMVQAAQKSKIPAPSFQNQPPQVNPAGQAAISAGGQTLGSMLPGGTEAEIEAEQKKAEETSPTTVATPTINIAKAYFENIQPENLSLVPVAADLNNNPDGKIKIKCEATISKSPQKILNNEVQFTAILKLNQKEFFYKIPSTGVSLEENISTPFNKTFLIDYDIPVEAYGTYELSFVASVQNQKFLSTPNKFSVIVGKALLDTGNIQVIQGSGVDNLNIRTDPPIFYTNLLKNSKNKVLFEFLKPFVDINSAAAKSSEIFESAQPKQISVYRTTTLPLNIEEIYNSSNLYKVLEISNGLIFTDDLEIGRDYYYMAAYKASYSVIKKDPIKPAGSYNWTKFDISPALSSDEIAKISSVADSLNNPKEVQDWNNQVISDSKSEFNPKNNIRLYTGVLYAVDNRNVIDLNAALGITSMVNESYGISKVFKITVNKDSEFYYLDREAIYFEDLIDKQLTEKINSKVFLEPKYFYDFSNIKSLGDLFIKSTVKNFSTGNASFNSATDYGYFKLRLTSKKTNRKIDINVKNTLLQNFNYVDSKDILKGKKYNVLTADLRLLFNANLYDYFINLTPKKVAVEDEETKLYNNLVKIYKYSVNNFLFKKQFAISSFLTKQDEIIQNLSSGTPNEVFDFISKNSEEGKAAIQEINNLFLDLSNSVKNYKSANSINEDLEYNIAPQEILDFQNNVAESLQNVWGIGDDEYQAYVTQILNPTYTSPLDVFNSYDLLTADTPLKIINSSTFSKIENIRFKALYDSIKEALSTASAGGISSFAQEEIEKIDNLMQKIIKLSEFNISNPYLDKIINFYNSGISKEKDLQDAADNLKDYNSADTLLKAKNEIIKYAPDLVEKQQTIISQYDELTSQEEAEIIDFLNESIKTFDISSYSALNINSTGLLQTLKLYLEKIKKIANFLNKNTQSKITFSYIKPSQLVITNPTVSFIVALENENKNIADKFLLKINLVE